MAEPAEQAKAAKKPAQTPAQPEAAEVAKPVPDEIGGPQGPEPTRFGDWEKAGRCSDF